MKFGSVMAVLVSAIWIGDAFYCLWAYFSGLPVGRIVWLGAAFGFLSAATHQVKLLIEAEA